MFRILTFLIIVLFLGVGFASLADYPATLVLSLPGWRINFTPVAAVIMLLLFLAVLILLIYIAKLLLAPFTWHGVWQRQKKAGAYKSLTEGLMAAFAGDSATAQTKQAEITKALPPVKEPLAVLLPTQIITLNAEENLFFSRFNSGRKNIIPPQVKEIIQPFLRRQFITGKNDKSNTINRDWCSVALRALFTQAQAEKNFTAASHYALLAAEENPALIWASLGATVANVQKGEWKTALTTYENFAQAWYKRAKQDNSDSIKNTLNYYRQILLCGQAAALFPYQPRQAQNLALEAYECDKNFIPASVLSAEILFQLNEIHKAEKLLLGRWKQNPHPDLGRAYISCGGTIKNKIQKRERAQKLMDFMPDSAIGQKLLAKAAFAVEDYALAQRYAEKAAKQEPTAQIFILLAKLASKAEKTAETIHFLTKSLTADPEKAWVADGQTLNRWQILGPISYELGVCRWQTPAPAIGNEEKLEMLLNLPNTTKTEVSPAKATMEKPQIQQNTGYFAPLHGFALPETKENETVDPTYINVDNPGVNKTANKADKTSNQ